MTYFTPSGFGYFGKLPAKGDFVGAGLAEGFLAGWDAWSRRFLVASRAALGEGWEAAWMQAPVWHFLMPAGACGELAVLGVWVASVDKVGRHFPFMVCALAGSAMDLTGGGGWLELAEGVAVGGVAEDAAHEDFLMRLAEPAADGELSGPGWWTQGSPLVAPRRMDIVGLPAVELAAGMLRDLEPEGAEVR